MDPLTTQRWYKECEGKTADELISFLQKLEKQNESNPGGNLPLAEHIGFVRGQLLKVFGIDK